MSDEVYHDLLSEDGSSGGGRSGGGGGGRLELLEEAEVGEAWWQADGGAAGGHVAVRLVGGRRADVDFVWLATGGSPDLARVPLLASLLRQRPVPTAGGLPVLQPDLAWDAACPFFVMGAFAGLELGPDALNLAGARSGGVLVARALLQSKLGRGSSSKSAAGASAARSEENRARKAG